MLAAGRGAWYNGRGAIPLVQAVERAKGLDFVIVKALYWDALRAFLDAGLTCGIERYVYPDQPIPEAALLLDGIRAGAQFIVINAEVKWESRPSQAMQELIDAIRQQTQVEIYASVDTRGNRTHLPYQQVLREHATGILPMVYPGAFYPAQPAGYINWAFTSSLDMGQDFGDLPVLPTIQTYAWEIDEAERRLGAEGVAEEIAECKQRGFQGWQAYTISHASDEEWAVFKEKDMNNTEKKLQALETAVQLLQSQLSELREQFLDTQRGLDYVARSVSAAWQGYQEGRYRVK